MANALTDLANSMFRRRTTSETTGTLGSGAANKAANAALMAEYRNHAKIAEAEGEDFPSFEEWLKQRG
jgi:hypothetical protein